MRLPAVDCAVFARAAEDMFAPGVLTPELDERLAGWRIVGYLSALNALFGLQDLNLGARCYYGFVAQNNADPADYIAVFRGTELPVEWLSDCRFLPRRLPRVGFVPRGFWEIYESAHFTRLGEDLGEIAAIGIADAVPDCCTVTVIGHSLGAALATYLTRDLTISAAGRFKVEGQFFASPKPGDTMYSESFASTVSDYETTNYVRDLVPHLPLIGYTALHNVHWLKPGNVDLPNDLAANHNVLNYEARLRAEAAVAA